MPAHIPLAGRAVVTLLATTLAMIHPACASEDDPELSGFIALLAKERAAAGISAATFEHATKGLTRDTDVAQRVMRQPEHELATGAYVTRLVSQARIDRGRERLTSLADALQAIEARYGIDRHIFVAVWGVESSYGAAIGDYSVVRSLATLAITDARRSVYWKKELLAALKILESGDARPEDMVGSWAGAVGQTQFMPTTFQRYAVDFNGDGRRDLWRTPEDALASTAAYLASSGWRRGEAWGLEVILPPDFDFDHTGMGRKPVSYWRDKGAAAAGGAPWPAADTALRLLLPSGAGGPAFLVGAGFDAVLRYNPSLSYALAVCHLADRITGGPGFVTAWPQDERALVRAEREELQRLLAAAGFDPGPVDGLLGGLTRGALRSYQKRSALPPDGHPSHLILERLRGEQAGGVLRSDP